MITDSRYSDWLRAGRPRDRSSSPGKGKISSSPRRLDQLWGPSSLLPSGYRAVKWLRHEADHSPPTSVDVKNTWIYTYIYSPTRLHGVVLN
jgi:hypothetical protein